MNVCSRLRGKPFKLTVPVWTFVIRTFLFVFVLAQNKCMFLTSIKLDKSHMKPHKSHV